MQARDLIHPAERIYAVTMPERGQASGWYRINDEETFVEQIAQHPSFKGCAGPQASDVKGGPRFRLTSSNISQVNSFKPADTICGHDIGRVRGVTGGMERIAPA
jgi:hypothetical protein